MPLALHEWKHSALSHYISTLCRTASFSNNASRRPLIANKVSSQIMKFSLPKTAENLTEVSLIANTGNYELPRCVRMPHQKCLHE